MIRGFSYGSEKELESSIPLQSLLEPVPDRQLIHEHGSQNKPLCCHFAFGRNVSMPIEDRFEMFVKVLYGKRAQLVKEASYFHAPVGMRILSRLRCHQSRRRSRL